MPDLSDADAARLSTILTPRLSEFCPYEPTPKQMAFLLVNDVKEVLYGGAASGGKSVGQLMAATQYVDVPDYSAILFRRTYADLALPGALMDMARSWFSPWIHKNQIHYSDKDHRYTFPSGATLSFGYLEHEGDCERYQGAEFNYIGIDECTHVSPSNYTYMFSRLRKTVDIDVPSRFRATCNPGGRFGQWYYERFFGPDKGDRVFIPAGIYDNPHVDTDDYIESLEELDPITREQLLNGNWEIRESGDFFDRSWFTEINQDALPQHMKVVRCWDIASTEENKAKGMSISHDPDYTASVKMGFSKGTYFILDITRDRKSPADVETLIRETAEEDGYQCAVRMEKEPGSSGDMVEEHYRKDILSGYNFDVFRATGKKTDRAALAAAASRKGKVCILKTCRNKPEFYDELDAFPFGMHDDMVDAFAHSYNYYGVKPASMPIPITMGKSGGSYWKGQTRGF